MLLRDARAGENRFIVCARPQGLTGLAQAAFDVLSQANNHSLNYGQIAYEESVEQLAERGLAVTDPERLVVEEVKGVTFGFLGFDDVTKPIDLAVATAAIASASAQAAVVVPLVHWGVEYVDQPMPRQREVAQAMAQAGAKIIIGSHPHWVQGVEKVGETLVFWSLGNFVFDQMWSEETRSGRIAFLKLKVQNSKLKDIEYELVSVKIYDYGQPRW